jgi:pyruvate/2-oxoglutarate dehydrogenase complex dihydrolipoamide acyltransferase (E2) component
VTVDVRLPQWGMAMQDAEIVRWLKAEGDAVEEGEPIVEVETAKVSETVKAPASGRLVRILASEGTTVEVAQTIAKLEPA